jgi:hypothetical protein
MKNNQTSGFVLICLVILIAATLVIAGCVGSTSGQSQVSSTNDKQSEHPATGTTVATRATASTPLKTVKPTPAPGLSTAGVAIDPISDKKTGDRFLLTATTSLPAGTEIMWQILPDTGTPPSNLDGNSQMSVGANNQVIKGEGTTNRISVAVDLGRLEPGKYAVIVGEEKGNEYAIGSRFGYTYFTLK